MTGTGLLRLAYAFNIAVLLPVVWSLYVHEGQGALAAFNGRVENADGLRLLVAAFWSAVIICSALGLWRPHAFSALLVFQVVYKSIYLATFAWPAWRAGGMSAVPLGVTAVFAFIVAAWPFIILAAWRSAIPNES